ncbi:MAG TPA: cytochrome c oxidase subunit II [Sphingomicrobium sp.]|jgi:cytochrome c oxidase subunit II|nr:cytochrome c oxidase subunit II [Sphingomicrobium sp.]
MKLTGWAIALAAAGLTPAAAAAPQAGVPEAAAPQAAPATPQEDAPAAGTPSAGESDPTATQLATVPFQHALPEDRIGYPAGNRGIQPQVTELGRQGANFHDYNLLFWCAAISLFVLGLLTYAIVRFRRSRNPEPSRTSHNTLLEVVWTVVPVLILVIIAIPSMRLLRAQYSPPPADLTIKVIGNQWYWTYQYPDHGGFEIVSNMLREQGDVGPGQRFRTDADGPPLLAVDERLVIPAGKVVKFIVTSSDVIHSFGVPAFWAKIDANPGQLNETWAKVDRPGVYFGQCYELCGARHAYMPIAVEVVPEATFAAWVASKGGAMPGAQPASAPAGGEAAAPTTGTQPAGGETTAAQN